MPNEIEPEESLTEDVPFDMNSFVDGLLMQEESEASEDVDDDVDAVEDGPEFEDEGELSEEDDGTAAEEGQDDEDQPETPESTEGAPKSEDKVDPRDEEIAALKELARNQNQQLIDLLQQQVALNQQKLNQAPKAPESELSEEAARIALFGGDDKAWESLTPKEKAAGKKFAQEWIDRQTRYARNPEALYEELIKDRVRREIESYVAPVLQETHTKRAQEIIDRHAKDLVGEHRERVHAVYQALPGSRSNSWEDIEATFEAAAKLVRMEVAQGDLATRERKVEAAKRQKEANREAARSVGRKGTRRPKTKSKVPQWDPSQMDLEQFAQILQDKES